MSFEEPTQRLSVARPEPTQDAASQTTAAQTTAAQTTAAQTTAAQTTAAQTTAALPRPLNLADPTPPSPPEREPEPADRTDELSLDELFTAPDRRPAEPARADEASTWTAMPVIPVRSEPIAAREASTRGETAQTAQKGRERTGPSMGERLLADATAAWGAAVRRSRAWLGRDDNGLMLMTALVAVILIFVVAAAGS